MCSGGAREATHGSSIATAVEAVPRRARPSLCHISDSCLCAINRIICGWALTFLSFPTVSRSLSSLPSASPPPSNTMTKAKASKKVATDTALEKVHTVVEGKVEKPAKAPKEVKPKKEKKAKDPNEPKRPANGYARFMQERM